jgi:acyl-CoA reductase-like NAD-dependent aldehyde dehydrogenase
MDFDKITFPLAPWIILTSSNSSTVYLNPHTGETVPEEPNKVAEWKDTAIELYLKSTPWRRAKDAKGRAYFFRKGSNETKWHLDEVAALGKYLTGLSQRQHKEKFDAIAMSNRDREISSPVGYIRFFI